MITATQPTLDFVSFNDLINWSVRYLRENRSNYKNTFTLVRIGDFLKRNRHIIEIQDDALYTRVTIRLYTKGVLKRDEAIGRTIGTKRQFVVSPGQFILSKIDARNGAFGLVPPELDGAVTTADFLSYNVDTSRINPAFLTLVSSTKEFLKICQSSSSGTTGRQRVDETQLLNIKIPLPSLTEQDRIVAAYNARIAEAKRLEEEAEELEKGIESYLFEELGVSMPKVFKSQGLILATFKDLTRWDTLYVLGKVFEYKSDFSKVRLDKIILNFMVDNSGSTLRIETSKFADSEFNYLGMENVEKTTGELLDVKMVKGNTVKSQTLRVPNGYFIYGKLRPYLNKYWLNDNDGDDYICSSEFFAFSLCEELVDRYFLKYILASTIVQEQIKDKTSGARMPRINESTFLDLVIPIPPLPIQRQIVQDLNILKFQRSQAVNKSVFLQQQAIEDFEAELFAA